MRAYEKQKIKGDVYVVFNQDGKRIRFKFSSRK